MMKICSANVLGEPWNVMMVGYKEDKWFKKTGCAGRCCFGQKRIVFVDPTTDTRVEYETTQEMLYLTRILLRHELIHAFLCEAGLDQNSHVCEEAWCENEEMIEFFAVQMDKIQSQMDFVWECVSKYFSNESEGEDGPSQT